MQHTAGRVLVGVVGLVIVVCGIVLVVEGARKKFMKYLRDGADERQDAPRRRSCSA